MLQEHQSPSKMEFIIASTRLVALNQFVIGRKAMTNLDSVLKSKDITLPTKVSTVKAMLFLAVT